MLVVKAKYQPPRPDPLSQREQQIAALIRRALKVLAASATGQEVAEALRTSNAARAIGALDWQTFMSTLSNAASHFTQEMAAAGTALSLPNQVGFGFRFNAVDPRMVGWAQAQAAAMVTDIDQATRMILRRTVTEAFTEGITWQDTARRIQQHIGLTDRGTRQVERMRSNVFDQHIKAGRTVEEAHSLANAQAGRFSQRLVRQRSQTIARTEILRAENTGRYMGFQQAVESGYADPKSMKKWRIGGTSLSGRETCPRCRPMDAEVVPWDEGFSNGILFPPAHPNCRCTFTTLPPGSKRLAQTPEPAKDLTTAPPATLGVPSYPRTPFVQAPRDNYQRKPDVSNDILNNPATLSELAQQVEANSTPEFKARRGVIDVATMADHLGYHDKPTVVTAAHMDQLVSTSGFMELFRGLEAKGALTSAEMAELWRTGDTHYIGAGMFGHGSYAATAHHTAATYARSSAKVGSVGRMRSGGYIMRIGLRPDAKVIDSDLITKDWREYVRKQKAGNPDAQKVFFDVSSYAMARGYDAIKTMEIDGGHYYVILNRAATVVQGG